MAVVRVLAQRVGNDRTTLPRVAYRAQIFVDENLDGPVWTCPHAHRTPVDAQACGLQFVTGELGAETGPAGLKAG